MASDREPNGSSRYVTRYEWDTQQRANERFEKDMRHAVDRNSGRINDLEAKWDRYAGPAVVVLAILGFIATITSIASAVVVVASST